MSDLFLVGFTKWSKYSIIALNPDTSCLTIVQKVILF